MDWVWHHGHLPTPSPLQCMLSTSLMSSFTPFNVHDRPPKSVYIPPLQPVLLMDMVGLFNRHHQCVEMIRFKLSLGNLFVFSESWPSFILLRVARTVGSHLALALPGTFTPSVTRILWLGQPKYSPFKILNCWRKIWPLIQWMILITGAEQIFLAYSSLHVWLETSWYHYKHSTFSN